MKRIFTFSVFLFMIFCSAKKTTAQNSCTQYVLDSFRLRQGPGGLDSVYLLYTDPSSGAKSSRVTAICGTDTVFNTCYNTSNKFKNDTLRLLTSSFTCPDLSSLKIIVAAYTGDTTCHGTACYTLISVAGGPLPIYFKSFTANRVADAVILQWATAFEENNRGFEIDRMIGMGDWVSIAFVNSAALNGNSNSDLNYSFKDEDNTNEFTFYRLKQVDLDNQFSYSPVRSVQGLRTTGLNVIIFPNPSRNGETTITFTDVTQSYNLALIDANGRVLKQWGNVHGSNFNLTGLMPGWYNLLILAKESGKQTVEKFIVTR